MPTANSTLAKCRLLNIFASANTSADAKAGGTSPICQTLAVTSRTDITMKKIIRLDILSLIIGTLFLTICLFIKNSSFDVNIHDTYLIIDFLTMGLCIFAIHLLYATVYYLTRRHQKYLLGLLHLLLATPILIYILMTYFKYYQPVPRRYYTSGDPSVFENIFLSDPTTLFLTLFFAGQVFFVLNIAFSIYKKVRSADT